MQYDESARFESSLAKDGVVCWSRIPADVSNEHELSARARLTVEFRNIDWTLLRAVYGWSAMQYQAWTRGYLDIRGAEKKPILVYTDDILELRIDGKLHFGGDVYSYRNAPIVLLLGSGRHTIDVRLIRDLRAMGGDENPRIEVLLCFQRSMSELAVDVDKLIAPEIVEGKLVSTFACVPVRNESSEWMDVWQVDSVKVNPISGQGPILPLADVCASKISLRN